MRIESFVGVTVARLDTIDITHVKQYHVEKLNDGPKTREQNIVRFFR